MHLSFDKEADALYIAIGEENPHEHSVKRSERIQNSPIVLDYDENGKLFGIEVFDLSSCTQTGFAQDFSLQYASQSNNRREAV